MQNLDPTPNPELVLTSSCALSADMAKLRHCCTVLLLLFTSVSAHSDFFTSIGEFLLPQKVQLRLSPQVNCVYCFVLFPQDTWRTFCLWRGTWCLRWRTTSEQRRTNCSESSGEVSVWDIRLTVLFLLPLALLECEVSHSGKATTPYVSFASVCLCVSAGGRTGWTRSRLPVLRIPRVSWVTRWTPSNW